MFTDFDGNVGLNEAKKAPRDSKMLCLKIVRVPSDDIFRRTHGRHIMLMKDSRREEERIDGIPPMGEETDVEKGHLEEEFDYLEVDGCFAQCWEGD